MSADHLMASTTPTELSPPTPTAPRDVAQGVLTVLSGTPLDQAAAEVGMNPTDLTDAIRCFQQAGYAVLEAQAERQWYQVHLEFSHWDSIEHTVVTSLAPRLQHLQDTGVVASWWFMRKAPGLRLRIKPGSTYPALAAAVDPLFEELTSTGVLTHWRRTLYEPEEAAFGGHPGMEIAHELFSTDSHHILSYLRYEPPPIGRRELSALLCTTLFRAAGQEWFECGDIWHRVARYRPAPVTDKIDQVASQLRIILAHDTQPTGTLFGTNGSLAILAPWATSFHQTGQALAVAASNGALQRGIRAVLAHHVIFHWNRLGLPLSTQSILAHVATRIILDG